MDDTLCKITYGKGAHVDPIACVEDIPAVLATRTVSGYPHSIWQIVEHMNYWMEHDLSRIAGENRRYPEHAIESWPAPPEPADEAQWHTVVGRFSEMLSRMATLARSDSVILECVVDNLGPGSIPRPSTVRTMLWQIVAHNSYHIGQVALLRRQLGAWPPQRGGDTW